MGRLDGKVAIITGAASGQGAAEARLFAAEGARVVLTDQNEQAGREVERTIGGDALFVPHDVTDQAAWDRVIAAALDRFDAVDVLVNNAGIYATGTVQETDVEALDRFYRINALSAFLGIKAVHAPMTRAGGGSIVNIVSISATRGMAGSFAYSVSKWMMRGMSKCAAVDLAGSNIRVNAILPGAIDTPMLAINSPEFLDAVREMIPAKRFGMPDDVARTALFLASDESSYIMGAEIAVCGAVAA